MVIEYGVTTGNKFALANLSDDDETLDPSELLSRLETSTKDAKSSALISKKKVAATLPKKLVSAPPEKLTTANKIDLTRQPRNITNKENVGYTDGNRETGPRRFPRGGSGYARGMPRNRPPRQDRSDMPPRFRQPNDNEEAFEQNGFNNDNRDSFTPVDQMGVRENGFGGGFGGGFNNADDSVNAQDGRQLNRSRGFGGRGGGGGFNGGGRPYGGGFGGQPRNVRRPYDRQSGSDKTGVKAIDKRDGAGAHNWGSAADVIADDAVVGAQVTDESAVAVDDNEKVMEGNEGDKTADNAQNEAVEPEPVLLTLDEWKALQGQRQRPQFNVRRPGEGEKNPAWEKLKPLKGGEESKKGKNKSKGRESMPVEEADEDEEEIEDNRVIPIDIRFIGEPMRRGGGRGRGRGIGGGGGGFRGMGRPSPSFTPKKDESDHRDETPYKIDDESFPSLS